MLSGKAEWRSIDSPLCMNRDCCYAIKSIVQSLMIQVGQETNHILMFVNNTYSLFCASHNQYGGG